MLEGIFAVDKPANVSSADVLLGLQETFAASETFRPLLDDLAQKRAEQALHQPHGQKKKRDEDERAFKMGHGGTLDPLASGVLIVGIGRGTKRLGDYLACKKTYETVVLFGIETDTYDITGKTVARAETAQVTRALVESKLSGFVGMIEQIPPIYSALKIRGVKACEYIRSGRELPRELETRKMQVDECILLDWYEENHCDSTRPLDQTLDSVGQSRKDRIAPNGLSPPSGGAPAARIRLTVPSGFYVRSFAHDLGISCGTYGTMAELRRTRQANFLTMDSSVSIANDTALDYTILRSDEETWAPTLKAQLSAWMLANPTSASRNINGRDPEARRAAAILRENQPRQRHRGEWQATSKRERRKQSKECANHARNEEIPIPTFES